MRRGRDGRASRGGKASTCPDHDCQALRRNDPMTKKRNSKTTKGRLPDNEMLLALYALLRGLEPSEKRLDVIWNGPFWVEKKGVWHPTSFLLYRGLLRGQIHL